MHSLQVYSYAITTKSGFAKIIFRNGQPKSVLNNMFTGYIYTYTALRLQLCLVNW